MENNKWDLRFMELAVNVSKWSKDTTKVGCCIVKGRTPISFGFNGFPKNVDDNVSERHIRPIKYEYTVHSEINGIILAAKNGHSTNNCTMYVTLYPCSNCAGAIINAGIKTVVCKEKPNFNDEKWGKIWKISEIMFNEANIIIKFL